MEGQRDEGKGREGQRDEGKGTEGKDRGMKRRQEYTKKRHREKD